MQDRRHKEGREQAHGQTYDDWTIRRQPSSEMKRSGIELEHGEKHRVHGEKHRGHDEKHRGLNRQQEEGGNQNDNGKGRCHP